MATSNRRGKFSHVQRTNGKRSRYESEVADFLTEQGIEFDHEPGRIAYFDNGRLRYYIPDFAFPNGVLLECKGWFQPQDRTKHLLVREQNPDLDIRFVFQRAGNKLNPTSKTTYAAWCEKAGFIYADKLPPLDWFTNLTRTSQ